MTRLARLTLAAAAAACCLAADAPTTMPSAKPPADAVVLFDGTEASEQANWTLRKGQPAAWAVADGAMTSSKSDLVTKQKFHDFTLHVEFCEPKMADDVKGQARGNSGVYLQGRYEIQVLDSYGINPPTKGDCGAIYNQAAPTENACLPPGQWQAYDITFHAAVYDGDKRTAKPRATVVLNGKTVQDNVEINHVTGSELMKDGPADGPILIQFHHNGVQFRNVWIVPHA